MEPAGHTELVRILEHGEILIFETRNSPGLVYTMTTTLWQALELVKMGASFRTTWPATVAAEKIGSHARDWTLRELIVGLCALATSLGVEPFMEGELPPPDTNRA